MHDDFDEDDFDLGFDFDDDMNDGETVEGDLPFPKEMDEDKVLTMKRCRENTKDCEMLKNISSVTVSMSVESDDAAKPYSDRQVTVSLTAKAGEYFKPNEFKCFIYTPDFFPMCKSTAKDTCYNRFGGKRLDIGMSCNCVWLPGKYVLLVTGGPDDAILGLVRYELTLTDRQTFEVGEQQQCAPCGMEDTLIMCIEDSLEDWIPFARTPGMSQLRQFAMKIKQIFIYNEYRTMMKGGVIGYSRNLLISTRNRDMDEALLKSFAYVVGYGSQFRYVDCYKLYDPSHANPYDVLSEDLDGTRQQLICLANIGVMLSAGGKVIVRKIMELMSDKSYGNMLWICGTRQEIDTLLSLYPTLAALFLKGNRLEQEPYSAFEMVQAFVSLLAGESLECSPMSCAALTQAVLHGYEKGTLSGWSLNDIRRFVCEEIRPCYLERGLANIISEQLPLLSVDDLCLDKLTSGTSSFEESMRQLNAMIGLDEVKQGIRTMANNARLYLERRRRGFKTSDDMVFHCIFTGNPGTGKTTVARMLGRIYHSLGLLSKGDVIVADRTRLVGQFIGQTEDNMKAVLEEARGNVLFIDEAYTLNTGAEDKKDYGHRVIESLLTVLSQPDPDMLIVFAGYTNEMDAMLSTNPGLSGRFPYRYLFKDYNEEQLMLIARRLFDRDEYILTDEAVTALQDAISQTLQQKLPNFGNARWIEQFVKNGIIPAMADRLFSTGCDDFQRIEASDIKDAYERFCPKAISLKPTHRRVVGFSA